MANNIRYSPLRFSGIRSDGQARWDFSAIKNFKFKERVTMQYRAECLNALWFLTLDDAQQKLEDWRKYYNEERPHSAIGHKAPVTLINHAGVTNPPSCLKVENSS